MARITDYTLQDDGSYQIAVSGVTLGEVDMMMIDNGFALDAEVDVVDGRTITIKQRKKVFALLNDIYIHTGQPQDDLRNIFQFYLEVMQGYDPISLKDTTVTVARELIDLIMTFVFQNSIPLNYKTSDLMREDNRFLYLATINRQCVICGKSNSDLAHREAVGSGRNRKTINHYGHHVLALCREHHGEQHAIGIDTFDNKYHLVDSWVPVNDELNNMLKGK